MIQNSSVAASLLNSQVMDLAKGSSVKNTVRSDDTFRNMLNEKIQARDRSESARQDVVKKPDLLLNRDEPRTAERESTVKEPAKTQKPAREAKVKETTGEIDAEGVSEEDSDAEELQKQISSLEALMALLENLLAQLDTETVSADPSESKTQPELILPASGSANPMELLMALLEGNTEKLRVLLDQIDQGQQSPEIKDLLETIQKLLEKLTKEENGPDGDLSLNLELEGTGTSREELIDQLKAQCFGAIQKIKEKVSELKSTLNEIQEGESEASALSSSSEVQTSEQLKTDTVKNEDKSDSKTKGDNENPLLAHQNVESIQGKTVLEGEESVYQNFSLSAQQNPQEATAKVEKTPLPLSEKPLAQTVTNQVMMKVKLMAGESKQEMEMHLKPESLGKLSLKIIHERGEILAKITAENEQVKGIIESNMQLLKDALEKSGLTVQSLSVSVGNGQDKGQSRNSNESSRAGSKIIGENSKPLPVTEASYTRAQVAGGLYDQSSQIDLTA